MHRRVQFVELISIKTQESCINVKKAKLKEITIQYKYKYC